jgi:hypothetical protein
MNSIRVRAWLVAATGLWLAAAAVGLFFVWRFDNAAGEAARPPSSWPMQSQLVRASDRPTLLLIAHPQCSCTVASLGELAEVLARSVVHPKTYIVFLKPDGFSDEWVKGDLWQKATQLPGVVALRDQDGLEARRFGAATSGQTFLYDPSGRLEFSGGITGARAHEGDNAGRQSLVALLGDGQPGRPLETRTTSVFGCPLFNAGT